MRTHLHALILLLLLAGSALATPPAANPPAVTVSPTLAADPGTLIVIPIATNGKVVKALSPGIVLLPQFQPGATVPYAFVTVAKPGTYKLHFYTALADVPSDCACCTLTVSDPAPAPPTPPTPPSPLVQALQNAYASEAAPDRAQTLAALASLYGQATLTAQLPDLKTAGDLFDTMSTAAKTLGIRGKLQGVQTVIAGELQKALPSRSTPLDSASRDLAASAFKRISTALSKVK